MNLKSPFKSFILSTSSATSNKASSYIRALDMLGEILKVNGGKYKPIIDLWSVSSVELINEIYDHVLLEQRSGKMFQTSHAPSYWKDKFYSAALGAYRAFLIEHCYEEKLLKVYEETGPFDPMKFDQEIDNENLLIGGLKAEAGREVVREMKARVNQYVFRKKVFQVYNSECCLTGLNIPQINVASHILSWADHPQYRLDPCNGLCLSATYDAAFDRHLIGFDADYRMVLSSEIKEYFTKDVTKLYFEKLQGSTISLPMTCKPNPVFLAEHLRNVA